MSMRGAVNRPKDRMQRVNDLKRMKLSVERNLESASLTHVQDDINGLSERVERIDAHLAD